MTLIVGDLKEGLAWDSMATNEGLISHEDKSTYMKLNLQTLVTLSNCRLAKRLAATEGSTRRPDAYINTLFVAYGSASVSDLILKQIQTLDDGDLDSIHVPGNDWGLVMMASVPLSEAGRFYQFFAAAEGNLPFRPVDSGTDLQWGSAMGKSFVMGYRAGQATASSSKSELPDEIIQVAQRRILYVGGTISRCSFEHLQNREI